MKNAFSQSAQGRIRLHIDLDFFFSALRKVAETEFE